ncbi:MAG TPA: hypothetical protein PLR06_01665 [Cyclobacteriaceae bacterium]|nr:hypothetical protein [Cyclobacteriaceae bacterium]
MRKSFYVRTSLILFCVLAFGECSDKCNVTTTYTYFVPIYSTSAEVKQAVQFEEARPIKSPGRIYFKDQFLYINEAGEGIHVINNQNPASPTHVGFLKIPGNHELAIAGDMLYADSFVDLVVFDVSDKSSIHEVNRIEQVFDHTFWYGFASMANNLVLTGWKPISTISVQESECEDRRMLWGGIMYDAGIAMPSASFASTGGSPSTGVGGSLSRFTISSNTLYGLDGAYLDIVDVTQPESPRSIKEINTGWDVETLFPYKDKLFAGSRTGMYIYDLNNPNAPSLVSKYQHVMSCDPVVVNDNYAYVTLRTGNSCRGGVNQLEVINIANLSSPQVVKTFPMTNPYGLGIDNTTLFICDGDAGLKVFDASDVMQIDKHQLKSFPNIKPVDIVPFQNIAMVIASDGLYQYDYSDKENIHQVSKLVIAAQ